MKSGRLSLLLLSHAAAAIVGFAAGIYVLPILTAPSSPDASALRSTAERAEFKGQFRRDLKDSDPLHWGEGTVSVGRKAISLQGRIAPGPDYKLYLSPQFVETEADFMRLKPQMVRVGDVKTSKISSSRCLPMSIQASSRQSWSGVSPSASSSRRPSTSDAGVANHRQSRRPDPLPLPAGRSHPPLPDFDSQEWPWRAARQRLHAPRPSRHPGQDRRRPSAGRGVRRAPAHGRDPLGYLGPGPSSAGLDPDPHPLAVRPRARQESIRPCRYHAQIHLYPRLPGQCAHGHSPLSWVRAIRNQDVVELFDLAAIGTEVLIRE